MSFTEEVILKQLLRPRGISSWTCTLRNKTDHIRKRMQYYTGLQSLYEYQYYVMNHDHLKLKEIDNFVTSASQYKFVCRQDFMTGSCPYQNVGAGHVYILMEKPYICELLVLVIRKWWSQLTGVSYVNTESEWDISMGHSVALIKLSFVIYTIWNKWSTNWSCQPNEDIN